MHARQKWFLTRRTSDLVGCAVRRRRLQRAAPLVVGLLLTLTVPGADAVVGALATVLIVKAVALELFGAAFDLKYNM